jgi:transposase
VSREFDVPLREFHYDPTHILFHGLYEDSQPRPGVVDGDRIRSNDQLLPAHITKGRAMEDAPKGAKMIHGGLCTRVDQFGPLPLFGHTVDGNQNGHTAVAEQFALMHQYLKPAELTMFSDRGTFSAGHLARLQAAGFYAVCSVPWDEVRELFDQERKRLRWKKASYLSIEQQRRRKRKKKRNHDLPLEHYELAVTGYTWKDEESKELIPSRVIFVFSTADQKVVRKQRQKQIEKLQAGLAKLQHSVAQGHRSTDPQSVSRRVNKLFGTKQAARYFTWEMTPLTSQEKSRLPRPKPGCKKPTHRFTFDFDEAAVKRDEQYDGYSALVTTVPRQQSSADQLFTKFKQQTFSEHVNHIFKGPLAVHPVYLHTPERVEALVFLLMFTLTLYFLIQRMYRQSLPADAPVKEQRITTQTILNAFSNYTILIHHTRLGREVQPTRLTTRQRQLLQRLGFPTPARILSQCLPRAPT